MHYRIIIKNSCRFLTQGFLCIVIATCTVGAVTPMMSAGSYHSLILKSDGTLWACGSNNEGQLGDGTTRDRSTPIQIMISILSMFSGLGVEGSSHSLILKNDGTLWACGANWGGQLADGTITNRSIPVQVMTGVLSMSAGGAHSLILKTDGTLWACGANWESQLGDGTTTDRSTPILIMTGVHSMSAGLAHSLILKTDGTLWACGANMFGQLGDGTTTNRSTPIQVMTGVLCMSVGIYHSLILKNDGTLWACGANWRGQLADGTITNRSIPVQVMTGVLSMSAGFGHSLILKTDGTLWACGSNNEGQLCDGTTRDRSTPIQVMTGVLSMSAGGFHSLILKTDGTLWACGDNMFGQLGDGTTMNRPIPVRIMIVNSNNNCIPNLSARAKQDKIQLTWTDSNNSAYHIFRSTEDDSTAFVEIATRSGSYSTYLDIGLETGRKYWYKVFGDKDCDNPIVVSAIPESRVRR